jgi:hypothetical protein
MMKVVALASVAAIIAAPASAGLHSSAPSFAQAKSFRTGRGTNSIAIGDLNHDGSLDVVSTNSSVHTISVLLNRGDGRFHARLDYRVGNYPYSAAISDLNGDGAPDLATAGIGSVSILANRRDGTFAGHVDLDAGVGWPTTGGSIAIRDLNGDGNSDLVIVVGAVYVLLGRGDLTFEKRAVYQSGTDPHSVAAGDLNGDAMPDLVTANWGDDTISVLFNRGDGSFQPKHDYGAGLQPTSLAIDDLNGDGESDVVAADSGTRSVSVLLNRGQGTFGLEREYGIGGYGTSAAIGDLNGDSAPDLAITTYPTNAIAVLTNQGNGRFRAKLDLGMRRQLRAVAVGDLNRDSRLDLATANGNNTISVSVNTPGLCTVQNVKGVGLQTAKRKLARANCLVAKVKRSYSKTVKRGRVISQKPQFGAVLPGRGKVDLVVSRGRRLS